jgi:hypothetical protein
MRCGYGSRKLNHLLGLGDGPLQKPDSRWGSYKVSQAEEEAARKRIKAKESYKSNANPGQLVSLLDIPQTHVGWQYLFSEGFSEADIRRICADQDQGIFYCNQGFPYTAKPLNTTTHRLIFPIKDLGEDVGWQARWLPKAWPPNALEKSQLAQRPSILDKYITSPGLKKTFTLYNWDEAKKWDIIVPVEGIKKVWKAGGFSVGTLGISGSTTLEEGISPKMERRHWLHRLKTCGKPIWFLYDRSGLSSALEYAGFLSEAGVEAKVCALPEGMPDDVDAYSKESILQILYQRFGKLPQYIG